MSTIAVHHESEQLGRMVRVERDPHPALRGVVTRYCGYDHAGGGTVRRREVAQSQVTVILSFGPTLRVGGPNHPEAEYGSFLAALDRIIAARIEASREPSPDVAWAWNRLSGTGGMTAIGSLARELGCSRRHLAGRFREQIGPPPKVAARLLRFQRAVRLLGRDDGRRFAEIAADCGFSDQPHLNREFRDLAGTTPASFLASRLPDGMGIDAL